MMSILSALDEWVYVVVHADTDEFIAVFSTIEHAKTFTGDQHFNIEKTLVDEGVEA